MRAYALLNAAEFNSLVQIDDPLSVSPAYGTIGVAAGFSDFTAAPAPYSAAGTGTGSAANWGTGDTQRIGILSLDTGTTTTGCYSIYSQSTMFRFGGGQIRFIFAGRLPTASDGTDTYTARIGFNDTFSGGGDGVDGAFFRYTHSVNGGKWQCVTRSNSVETATDSGVAGVSASMQTFEIDINAAGTSCAFYIDGVLVATNTTNIPTGAGRETGISTHILKSAGTTSRSLLADFMGHRMVRSANV